ncbi:unnamed protein product [Parnassius apollo]|uniref:(apollo) hypothetical protein n=1 Tax=Parnassius apollo TaxID=110799 RepID=A0A8S3X2G5_PARAO|nr:unnamed protein product [Parnassius apollo]
MLLIKFREDFVKYLMGLSLNPAAVSSGASCAAPVQPQDAQDKLQLIPSSSLQGPSEPPRSPANVASRLSTNEGARVPLQNFHYLEKLPPTAKKAVPAKPCRVCTKNKKQKESSFVCATCPEKPALCVNNCFKIFYTDPRIA